MSGAGVTDLATMGRTALKQHTRVPAATDYQRVAIPLLAISVFGRAIAVESTDIVGSVFSLINGEAMDGRAC